MARIAIPIHILNEAADEVGCELRTEYSGRGMYGRTCVGVVVQSQGEVHQFLHFLRDHHEVGDSLVSDFEQSESSDSMGLNGIAYWPALEASSE